MANIVTQKVKKVDVRVRKLNVKVKKLSVRLVPISMSEHQRKIIKQFPLQKIGGKNVKKKVNVNKLRSRSKFKLALRHGISSNLVSLNKKDSAVSNVIHVADNVPKIQEMLSRGKVSRLATGLRWRWGVSLHENYGLGSEKSIQADSEDSPKKKVPAWAEEKRIKSALSACIDVDPDLIFALCEPPDLVNMFPSAASKRRDIWNSPTSSQSICATPQSTQVGDSWEEKDEEISFHLVTRDNTCDKSSRAVQQTAVVGSCKALFKGFSNRALHAETVK